MKVLTFGWEYPPIKNGGLGVASMGLTRELTALGIEVLFVLPREQDVLPDTRFLFANSTTGKLSVRAIEAILRPYQSSKALIAGFVPDGAKRYASRTLLSEVYRYAEEAAKIAADEEFDIIHAHDWTSYLAGLEAKRVSGKPCVLHVHATAYDQAGGSNVDPEIYKIEKEAFAKADGIIAVSHLTKDVIVTRYGAAPEKVEVAHNGVEAIGGERLLPLLSELKAAGKRIVLFHGRITIQKGPDYFVRAARRVVDVDPSVIFIVSGWGDMEHQVMQLVGSLGLSSNVLFVGALWGEERDRMYQSADLYVMPSVSEPFGIVALEALSHGTPVLISKQSGAAEVLAHALKVDFWDIEEMANQILAALRYPAMHGQLAREGREEAKGLSWRRAAIKVKDFFQQLFARYSNRREE